jgi:hypothetical protein
MINNETEWRGILAEQSEYVEDKYSYDKKGDIGAWTDFIRSTLVEYGSYLEKMHR